ncbi:MAG: DEAD/DEAH box helicase [Desulfobacterales bacterium]|nr:DEAD/DEAH box helicase [Desulfobacterales bacterium]
MADPIQQISEQSFSSLASQTPLVRAVLDLISIVYEPVNPGVLLNCLQRCGIVGPGGRELTPADLATALAQLRGLGLITDRNQCSTGALAEEITRGVVAAGSFAAMLAAVRAELPLAGFYGKREQKYWRLLREFRVGVYTHDVSLLEGLQPLLVPACVDAGLGAPAVRVCANPFQAGWFRTLPVSLQFYLLEQLLDHSLATFENVEAVIAYIRDDSARCSIPRAERLPFHRLLAEYLLWQGRPALVRELINRYPDSFVASGFAGCIAFLLDRNQEALALFAAELDQLRELTGDNKLFFYNLSGLFYILALLRSDQVASWPRIREWIDIARVNAPSSILQAIYSYLDVVLLPLGMDVTGLDLPGRQGSVRHGIVTLFAVLAQYWATGRFPAGTIARERLRADLSPLFEQARAGGFPWPAMEYAGILNELGGGDKYGEYAGAERLRTGLVLLVSSFPQAESWERRLKALISVAATEDAVLPCRSRLIWCVDYAGDRMTIVPKEQKGTSRGGWSKGRVVALSRLYAGRQIDFLTEQDLRICTAIRRQHRNHGTAHYEIDVNKALPLMIGHPLLFLADPGGGPGPAVEFIKGEPEVVVEDIADGLRIRLARDITEQGITVVPEGSNRFRIIEVDDRHRRIARVIGREGLAVPPIAAEMVMAAIGNLSSFMTIHSAIAMDPVRRRSVAITEVPAEERIWVQILPFASGFKLKMFVRPFGKGGPYLKPGRGVGVLMAEVGGRRLQARRDLGREEEQALEVEKACPTLAAAEEFDREWNLPELEECLQVLLELQPLQERITVEWPEGEPISVSRQASYEQLRVRVRQRRNWFELAGRMEVDEDLVLDMRRLLELARENPGRFIPLGERRFLALSEELRRRLNDLEMFWDEQPLRGADDEDQEPGVRFHPLAAPELADFCAQLETVDSDAGWREQLALLGQVHDFSPTLPSTLRAELRGYQTEGYVWLARLARWGVGACLADDMGLGKTLQALAIILDRARQGPTLVVAPTSVCMNWCAEATRFAPTLRVHLFNGRGRKELLKSLKKFDVLVTSYTLLQQEAGLLASLYWQTIVLDEAQAIKNMATKRSRAAMALDGGFKLLLTGTPIENHLGELWNLFNFINPGLLGSLERFNQRFAVPIERQGSREAGRRLRKMIRPFILRRIKAQVLEELPPRTEIVLHVERNKEEQAFYEALRRQALVSLQTVAPGARQNMQVLAEIMRLRRACCNTRLVAAQSKIPSSKLELFGKLVDELLENRHKALVFSQFVGHLKLIRQVLDQKGISYCYLDGATPVRKRKQQVESFQAGQGDLFLISLKAGGLGLNLTAADYVIHMDPWWNPAVEDQASDRAHRIGQTRPVTIYRLVAKGTIEERIVALHNEKRELADSLLQGSDISARVSVEELLNLIRER